MERVGSSVKLLILNGPNLNRIGKREPEIYGSESLDDVEVKLRAIASEHNVELSFFQSNTEGSLIDRIHEAADDHTDGIYLIRVRLRITVSHYVTR